jgi:putative sigma-54 modulation protein
MSVLAGQPVHRNAFFTHTNRPRAMLFHEHPIPGAEPAGGQRMRIETHGQQIEVTPALRDYVETKLARLGRHYDQPLDVRTLLTLDKPEHRAEATINVAGKTLHADAHAIDMYAAIDLLADKLDRLLVKHKEKLVDRHRGATSAARAGEFG